ncbi:MAG: CoA transferase subunit A [Limnochordia bacterium]|jgi:acetate CoA/acetoacetate CoA-transferase alpha subunit|nr:CoA transferase subunit A [Limnochordia bacterium]MDI9464106.1 CoA transferase subunit A [Bacillota bacterium]NLO96364.1 CoA transferase subunit A [Bacillota bacterium]HAI52250.1 branched-chain amino acid dehydrogenase [Bacillota bacterium]HAN94694.1 branched-chain amino acid dehydrogenase [Bacillota bacterium]
MPEILSVPEAVAKVKDGSTVMIGGFLTCGAPLNLIAELARRGVRDLTLIANDTGVQGNGIGMLISADAVANLITSHIGTNPETGRRMIEGRLQVELVPQGTLVERIRCGGAGLGGVLTPTGVGTIVAEGKQEFVIEGRTYLLETPLHADVALIKAWKADRKGNLIYRKSARNFNPIMAMAAELVIAEVEEILEVGELDPDQVVTPGIFVDILTKGVSSGD